MLNLFKKFWNNEVRIEKKLSSDQLDSIRNDIERMQNEHKISSVIIKYLQQHYPDDLSEKWQAERAYWTEVKRLDSLKIKNDSKAIGIDQFRIIPNTGACPLCIEFSNNGNKVFTRDQMKVKGVAVPPLHPGCYCLVLPYID